MNDFDLEYVSCNHCGKSDAELYAMVSYIDEMNRRPELLKKDDPILLNAEIANRKFSLVKCKNCGLIYVNPRLTRKSLAKLYETEYFSTKTLADMLKKIGFRIVKISYHYFNTPYASWKDPLKILFDIVSLNIRRPYAVSPPFYGNIIDMYAVKETV